MDEETQVWRQTDGMDVARAQALCATLGLDRMIRDGDPLPPFFHHIYFWDARPPERLGRDGHPRTGDGPIPDMGLPRRMWAGGDLHFLAPLRAGQKADKTTRLVRAERKTGRSGPLAFVTLQHDIRQQGQLCVTERQDLVYRSDQVADEARPVPPRSPDTWTDTRAHQFDSTMLFRYSALTFNGHRIHYDEAYARQVEGYDGLVVHGPLLAQLLMVWADTTLEPLRLFRFRATAPLMHHEAALLCRNGPRAWVRGPDGRMCLDAWINQDGA